MPLQSGEKSPRKFSYAWVVFAVCFLMIFVVLGFCSSSKSLYLAPVTEDLGVSRSLYSIADSFRYVTTAVVNLFFGTLILKWKPRRMAAIGFLCLIGFGVVNSLAQSVYALYFGGVLLGLGLSWTSTTLVGYVVEKWFTKSKGTIMGVILAANGLGAATASQIVSPIINASAGGWRNAYRLCAIVVGICGVVVVSLLRNTPEEIGQEPLGRDKTAKAKRGNNWQGLDYSQAAKKFYFYIALFCVFATGLILQSSSSVSSAHLKDVGIDPAFVATCLSLHSVCLAFAKMYTGFSYDKFGMKVTMLVCYICSAVSLLLLTFVHSNTMAICYSVISSFALPLETIMLPLIAMDLFGAKSYAKIMGLFVSVNTAGYAVGGPIINACFDLTGSYQIIFLIQVGLTVLVAVLMFISISMAHKEAEKLAAPAAE